MFRRQCCLSKTYFSKTCCLWCPVVPRSQSLLTGNPVALGQRYHNYAMAFLWCQKMKNSDNFISWVTCGIEIFNMKLVLGSVFWLILRGKKLVWATWVSKVTREGRCLWNTAHLFWFNGYQMLKISYRNSWKHHPLCSSVGFSNTYRLSGKLSALYASSIELHPDSLTNYSILSELQYTHPMNSD